MMIYGVYLGARLYGSHYHDQAAMDLGADWLAIGTKFQIAVSDACSEAE